jgi:cytidylate kinase
MAILSICRGTKSGGEALARCLAERLGYPILGREVAQEAAAQLGVPVKDLQEKMEERPGVFGRTSLLTKVYMAAVRNALAEAAQDGNLVYHGVAGGLLLKDVPGVICVRLIAPLDLRVQALMSAEGMDQIQAEAYIRDVDDARARWVRVMYGEDISDPALYDLVVNLDTFSIPEVCEILCRTAAQPEFALTEERMADLDDFRVESRVRLALLEDLGTQTLELGAQVRRGVAVVTGRAPIMKTGDVGERIVEIVRSVDGVQEARLDIEWFDPYP